MNQSENLGMDGWGYDDTRGYVGPKGWTISRSPADKLWRMEHISYEELSLTMLDMDALPVGRHNWRIENNVCNQGETSIETLLISGCKEDQFTCDDGKCLSINQRCNNIEDCDDVSDEKNCKTIAIDPEKYLKSKPPPSGGKKLPVTLSCDIMVVQDIQEVSQYIKLKFRLSLNWKDARVSFYNIKADEAL